MKRQFSSLISDQVENTTHTDKYLVLFGRNLKPFKYDRPTLVFPGIKHAHLPE